VAIFGNLFGQIFGDSAAELESRGDHFAGVNNWRRAVEEYRRALGKTNKTAVGYRRLAAKFDEARLKSFDAFVEDIHSRIDVREFTYAADQIAQARDLIETDEQRARLEECERRLRGTGRSSLAATAHGDGARPQAAAVATPAPGEAHAAARLERRPAEAPPRPEAAARAAGASVREPGPDQAFQKLLAGMAADQVAARVRLGAHYRDAALALSRGDAPRAVEGFTRALADNPDAPIVLYDLAAALAAAGRTREAQGLYHKMIERWPHDWQPYYEMAQLLWLDGLRDRALKALEDGLARHPRSGYLMAQCGVLLYKLGHPRQALEKLYQALQLDSFDDAGLYHAIANLHLELGDEDKARRGYLKALELKPNSVGTMLDYAEYLIDRKRDAPAAQAILETAFRALRTLPGHRLHQVYRSYLSSRVHLMLGDREMALLAVTRALEDNDQAWLEETLENQRQAVLGG
jgi:tetratricopeptide (TPR) repeat protein